MSVLALLTDFVLPIGSSLLLAIGLVSWQRSERFRAGRSLRPRRWEAVSILIGATMMACYVAFVVPFQTPTLRLVTVLLIVCPTAGVAWLARSSRRSPD